MTKIQLTLFKVPSHINRPQYAIDRKPTIIDMSLKPEIKTESQIQSMRKVCKMAKQTLDYAGSLVKVNDCFNVLTNFIQVGITTDQIDRLVHEKIISLNSYPSTMCMQINQNPPLIILRLQWLHKILLYICERSCLSWNS